jgi:hypothetical protein
VGPGMQADHWGFAPDARATNRNKLSHSGTRDALSADGTQCGRLRQSNTNSTGWVPWHHPPFVSVAVLLQMCAG